MPVRKTNAEEPRPDSMTTKEVLLEGPSPWGFRMTGGADVPSPLRISRVNPGSKAASKGVREGDLITSINRLPTRSLSNAESHALLRTVREDLLLGLNEDSTLSPKKRTKDHQEAPVPAAQSSPKGDKKTASKLRRERRSKLKDRIKGIFGLGKNKDEENNHNEDGRERSSEVESEASTVDSRRASVGSFGYDNLRVCKQTEPEEKKFLDKEVASESKQVTVEEFVSVMEKTEAEIIQQGNSEDVKIGPSCSDVILVCSDYLKSGEPVPDRTNDMNNNTAGQKPEPRDSRPPIIHRANESRLELSGVGAIPERAAQLCKATVSFEDGSGRLVEPDDGTYEDIDLSRCEPVFFPVRRFLEVIKEETSDLSDGERPREGSVKSSSREEWPAGIDTSWRDGRSLDDVSDVPVVSDSLSDSDNIEPLGRPPDGRRIYANVKPRRVPAPVVVKSVVSTYYNKSKPVLDTRDIQVTVEGPKDVEIVYIDSSDSDIISASEANPTSNRSSVDIVELSDESEHIFREILSDVASLSSLNFSDTETKPMNISENGVIEIVPNASLKTHKQSLVETKISNISPTFLKKDRFTVYSVSEPLETKIVEYQKLNTEKLNNEGIESETRLLNQTNSPSKNSTEKTESDKNVSKVTEISESTTKIVQLSRKEELEELKSKNKVSSLKERFDTNKVTLDERIEVIPPTPPKRTAVSKKYLNRIESSPSAVLPEQKNTNTSLDDTPNKPLLVTQISCESTVSSGSSHSTAKCVPRALPSLKELSTKVVLEIPQGKLILREIGIDQETIYDSGSEYFPETSDYSEQSRLSITSTDNDLNKSRTDLPAEEDLDRPSSAGSSIVFVPSGKHLSEQWIGLPLIDDPRYVVCFSPSQLKSAPPIDQIKAAQLLDLHKKFVHRRGYHEPTALGREVEPNLASLDVDDHREIYSPEVIAEAANLLALQEYHKERQERFKHSNDGARPEKVEPSESEENNAALEPNEFKNEPDGSVGSSRLLELIQKEEVKSSDTGASMLDKSTGPTASAARGPDGSYIISKRGDIAIRRERPRSLPPGEVFRRAMYDEYMDKVQERQERRQLKVLRVSEAGATGPATGDAHRLESEFMDKVRRRMEKLGLPEDDPSEPEADPLPKHLQEFVEILQDGVWSPAQTPEGEWKGEGEGREEGQGRPASQPSEEEVPPVWAPRSAGPSPTLDRKKYKPINFQSPPPQRKQIHPLKQEPEPPKELPKPLDLSPKLPSSQSPTITLLQKAREGQIPKGAQYLEGEQTEQRHSTTTSIGRDHIIYTVKKEYESDSDDKRRKIVELTPRKVEGIGPTTKEGTPIALRSEVKEDNQQRWYKRMYDSLHKADHDKDYVTVRYRTNRKGLAPYSSWASSGYLSEPDRLTYDSDAGSTKYSTLDRRKVKSRDSDLTSIKYSPAVRHAVDIYKNQPGRIEDYEPGKSSIADKEKQQWWEEVLNIFDGEFRSQNNPEISRTLDSSAKSFTSVLKDTGYESDNTLVYKRREAASDMSLAEQKEAYRTIQRGGEVPLHGLRKPAPARPKESGREYVEGEVNIHYRSPVRRETKEYIEEGELARRQAEAMRRVYQQQRRAKYLAELNDIHSRRHTDYFTPSQKSPIPLNRYDDFPVDIPPARPRDRTPEPKLVARALYNFVGQSSRELSFRRGDIIFVRRQIDKNWYEGEHNAMIGLFPLSYVEIIPYDGIRTLPKKSTEGQARAKFNFQSQSHLELSLVKGELVLLTRRVDENWFEGRIGSKKGIFPVSYVEVLVEPSEEITYGTGGKPVVAPASHSIMLNGAKDLGSQLQPPRPPSLGSPVTPRESTQLSHLLHIDTRSDPIPYRAMYNYRPQNEDELELREGDVVYVMEKCDDGWYVGSLHRSGQFGTFPGNYVQRIP